MTRGEKAELGSRSPPTRHWEAGGPVMEQGFQGALI